MKRLRSPPPSSSPCSSSSSSSCLLEGPGPCCGSLDHHQQPNTPPKSKSKSKRVRRSQKKHNSDESNNSNSATATVTAKRSSIYRGVTRHRWTGRFEAHLWDKSSWNNFQNKKGRQVYLGAYDSEEAAARTYDLAALKYWGPETTLNFSIEDYKKDFEEMQNVSKEEYLASLRRSSSGFSRGVSKYRGVARHHHNGRWEARIGRVLGNKYLYLGTYNTQEEAAAAYDMAAIQYRGANAVTNFDISNYIDRLHAKGIHIADFLLSHQPQPHHLTTAAHCSPSPQPQPQAVALHMATAKAEAEAEAEPEAVAVDTMKEEALANDMHPSTIIYDEDHPWNFCMDVEAGAYSYPSLNVSDIPFERYTGELLLLPDLLGDSGGFEDDIHLIFESGSTDCTDELLITP